MRLTTMALAVTVLGCGSSPKPITLPDFTLSDVNPSSATFQTEVPVHSELGKVSAWYFGHST